MFLVIQISLNLAQKALMFVASLLLSPLSLADDFNLKEITVYRIYVFLLASELGEVVCDWN